MGWGGAMEEARPGLVVSTALVPASQGAGL